MVSRSPRILFVTHNFPRTAGDAAGSFVLRLARALTDAGAEIQVLAPAAAGLADQDVIEGVSVTRVRYAREERQNLAYDGTMVETVRRSWAGRLALLGLLWHMRQATKRAVQDARRLGTPFDAVHAHWWFPSGLSAWQAGVGTAGQPPLVITMHGSDVRLARNSGWSHGIMRRVLKRARVVAAVSQWLADTAAAIVAHQSMYVAPMPVNTTQFVPAGDSARERVLFIGRLNAQKGVADLIDALARTAHVVHCDIVGDGPDRETLLQSARTLGVEDRITWHGALPSSALLPLYQQALVTVMPSRDEGLGLVAVESQLCGTPVIGYASGGLPDVVSPEHGGTLVPVGDTAGLARAVDGLAAEPDRARSLGEQGRSHVLRVFSPAHVAEHYLQLYAKAAQVTHA